VIKAVRNLPADLGKYFKRIGLLSLMVHGLKHESPYTILKIYGRAYRKATGNPSLFARRDGDCLRFDGKKRLIRKAA